jgi:hypothetical protein
MTDPVTTGQIYWGAIPFVIIQCVMVALIIAFPALVSYDKPDAGAQSGPQIDIQKMIQQDQDAQKPGDAAAPAAPATDDAALMKSLGGGSPAPAAPAGAPSDEDLMKSLRGDSPAPSPAPSPPPSPGK